MAAKACAAAAGPSSPGRCCCSTAPPCAMGVNASAVRLATPPLSAPSTCASHGIGPELAHRRAKSHASLDARDMLMEMFVAPVLLCGVARCASRVATLARIVSAWVPDPRDPEDCLAFSATFALAGAVTAGSRQQLAGWNAGAWEASDDRAPT